MIRTISLIAVLSLSILGCAENHSSSSKTGGMKSNDVGKPQLVAAATAAQQAALIDKMKSLQGTWEMSDEQGKPHTAAVFAVIANGSAVREIMIPGSPMEMTNMYHMDGPSMVMVHYCAHGNPPRLRAKTADAKGNQIVLKCDGVTNIVSADDDYMGSLTITFKDNDHIRQEWQTFKQDNRTENTVFDLTRKRS